MRSIAVINQKGGVGKTTSSVNLAAALVRLGRRVLLIDLDPQGHATLHVGVEVGPDDKTIYDVLTRGAALAEAARYVDDKLAVVPSSIDLAAAELELAESPDRELTLARKLDAYREHYDILIIDSPPSLGLLSVNALAAAREVVIPLQPHFLALQGLGRLLETVTLVRDSVQPALRVTGVVLCMCESGTRLAQEVSGDVESFLGQADPSVPWYGARVFDSRIRRNIKLAECPSFGKTIFEYAPSSNGAEDYRALAAEIDGAAAPPLILQSAVADADGIEPAGLDEAQQPVREAAAEPA